MRLWKDLRLDLNHKKNNAGSNWVRQRAHLLGLPGHKLQMCCKPWGAAATGDPRSSLYAGDDTRVGGCLDLLQTVNSSESQNLLAASTGSGAWLPSPGKDSGCLAALYHHWHPIDPEGTLKMSPQPRPRDNRPKLTYPQRFLSNRSWSLPKKSYCFPLKPKDREDWLLPWSSQQLHITPLVVEAVLKLL